MSELLRDARRFADETYLVAGSTEVTFRAHEAAVLHHAEQLKRRGITPGSRVALVGSNSPEWIIAFGAVICAGATVVLGNAWWSRLEMDHALSLVGAAAVIVDERRAHLISELYPTLDLRTFSAHAVPENVWELPDLAGDEDAPAVVLFTSGTTGLAKGVVLSHRSVIATLHALLASTSRLPSEETGPSLPLPTSLLSMPLFHIGGLQQIVTPLVRGTTLVFTEGRFDPAVVLDILQRRKVGTWTAVPTMVSRVIDHLVSTGSPGSPDLRTVSLGGAPVPEELRRRVSEFFPNVQRRLVVSYGLSESGGLVAAGASRELASRPGSVGRPLPSVEIGFEADPSGGAEILVRSPAVMTGYAVPSQVGEPLDVEPGGVDGSGWLHTGDLGRVDEDGFLYVTGRSKDIVIRGGENIATPHVEDQLLSHPGVREVAVFGLPHDSLGEELAAVVVVEADSDLTAEDLAAHLRERVSSFAVPSQWSLTTEPFVISATGKVVKRALRDAWIARLSDPGHRAPSTASTFQETGLDRHA